MYVLWQVLSILHMILVNKKNYNMNFDRKYGNT